MSLQQFGKSLRSATSPGPEGAEATAATTGCSGQLGKVAKPPLFPTEIPLVEPVTQAYGEFPFSAALRALRASQALVSSMPQLVSTMTRSVASYSKGKARYSSGTRYAFTQWKLRLVKLMKPVQSSSSRSNDASRCPSWPPGIPIYLDRPGIFFASCISRDLRCSGLEEVHTSATVERKAAAPAHIRNTSARREP